MKLMMTVVMMRPLISDDRVVAKALWVQSSLDLVKSQLCLYTPEKIAKESLRQGCKDRLVAKESWVCGSLLYLLDGYHPKSQLWCSPISNQKNLQS